MPLARGMGAKPEQPVVPITTDREITCSPLLVVLPMQERGAERFQLELDDTSWCAPTSPPPAAPPLTCGVLVEYF